MSSAEEVYYKLKSNDGEVLQISKKAHQRSEMLKTYLENNPIDDEESKTMEPIDLPNVSGKVAKQIIQWCEDHTPVINDVNDDDKSLAEKKSAEEAKEIKEKEKALFSDLDGEELLHLIMAADYMDIDCLRRFALKIVRAMISGQNYMEMRQRWLLESDFTAEEESRIPTDNVWNALVREMEKLEAGKVADGIAKINIAGDN